MPHFGTTSSREKYCYDLSLNRYKEVVHDVVVHRPPQDILSDLAKIETEIQTEMKELAELLL